MTIYKGTVSIIPKSKIKFRDDVSSIYIENWQSNPAYWMKLSKSPSINQKVENLNCIDSIKTFGTYIRSYTSNIEINPKEQVIAIWEVEAIY